MTHHSLARVWPMDRAGARFPERSHPSVEPPPLTGVCFSGGSTRSYAATVGHLRGLTESGLIARVGYISAVSGGAWAATPYTYYAGEAVSDEGVLGRHQEPGDLSVEELETIEPHMLGAAATHDFANCLGIAQSQPDISPEQIWSHAVGQMFLQRFGLFDPSRPAAFTLNEDTAREIAGRNAHIDAVHLRTVWNRSYRPYLLVHSTLNWPPEDPGGWPSRRLGFEYAPLGVGTPALHTLQAGAKRATIGGGFVEPFAFGGSPPRSAVTGDIVDVDPPGRVFTLAEMVGASSAFSAPDRDPRSYPHAECWPVGGVAGLPVSSRPVFTDGGDLENYGVIALLRRGIRGVVVFINSLWPLALDYDPTSWPDDRDETAPSRRQVDPFLAPLFGGPGSRFPHNRVFSEADYPDVISGLQEAKRRGGTVMTVSTHKVESNGWWGLEGGHDVKVCWIYNERVERWTTRLPHELQGLVRGGQADHPAGPFSRFPHYLTRGQNPGALIRLTPAQANLQAHLASWNVVSNRETLQGVLA